MVHARCLGSKLDVISDGVITKQPQKTSCICLKKRESGIKKLSKQLLLFDPIHQGKRKKEQQPCSLSEQTEKLLPVFIPVWDHSFQSMEWVIGAYFPIPVMCGSCSLMMRHFYVHNICVGNTPTALPPSASESRPRGKKKNITKPNLPHAKTNVSSNKPTTSKANNFLPLTFNRHKPGLWFL